MTFFRFIQFSHFYYYCRYILYKLPRLKHDTNPNVQTGHGYVYLDSSNLNFRLSKDSVAETDSAPGRTLDQVYNKYTVGRDYVKNNAQYLDGPTDQAHIFYNDEGPPRGNANFIGSTFSSVLFRVVSCCLNSLHIMKDLAGRW